MLVVFSLFLSFDIYVFSFFFFFYQVKGEMRRGGALPRTTRPLSSYHIGTQKLLCLSKEDFDSYTLTSNIFPQYRWSGSKHNFEGSRIVHFNNKTYTVNSVVVWLEN